MKSRDFLIKVADETTQELERVYGNDQDRLQAVLSLAVSQWSATLFGRVRYRSLTELFLSWLSEIISLDSATLEPNEELLYGAFNFPYGQAAYLSRVLRESQPKSLRVKYLTELEAALKARMAEAEQWIKDGRGEERLSLQVSKFARRELEHLLGILAKEGKPVHPLRVEGTLGDYVAILLVANDLHLLSECITKVRKELGKSRG